MIEDALAIPEHVRDALWRIDSAEIAPADSDGLVVCGLGGSAVGGDLGRALLGDRLTAPMETVRTGSLPSWVSDRTSALVSSHSGETPEAIEAFEQAGRRGLDRWALTTGGRLGEIARAEGVGVVGIPGFLAPRAAVGYTTTAAVRAAGLAGIAPDLREELESAVEAIGPATDSIVAQAESATASLAGLPVVIHGSGLTVPVARRWANQINENAKGFAFAAELPEAAHNGIEAWAASGPDFAAVFLIDPDATASERATVDAFAGMVGEYGAPAIEVDPGGDSRSESLLRAVMVGDLVSLGLAAESGVDPADIAAIEEFKRRTAGATVEGEGEG
jgi:glucose/mannose-6-phosphate isomerase